MEFLVRTRVTRPVSASDSDQAALVAAEKVVVEVMVSDGVLKRLWRVPGQWGSWVLYECPDATALHDCLSSLPMYPWMQIEVHPLARHPFDLA